MLELHESSFLVGFSWWWLPALPLRCPGALYLNSLNTGWLIGSFVWLKMGQSEVKNTSTLLCWTARRMTKRKSSSSVIHPSKYCSRRNWPPPPSLSTKGKKRRTSILARVWITILLYKIDEVSEIFFIIFKMQMLIYFFRNRVMFLYRLWKILCSSRFHSLWTSKVWNVWQRWSLEYFGYCYFWLRHLARSDHVYHSWVYVR